MALLVVLAAALAGPAAASAGVPREFYAISPQQVPNSAELDQMERGRVGTLRAQVSWAAAEPEPPTLTGHTYYFSLFDPIVLGATRRGIRVLPFIYSTPAWVARELDGRACSVDTCYFYAPTSPAARSAWKSFLGALVERYGPGGELWAEHPEVEPMPIRTWQIWNEQNSPTFYRPQPDVGAYAELLKSSADAIRPRDPGAEILLGGMFGTPSADRKLSPSAWRYLRRLYRTPGTATNFDGVAAHPYAATIQGVEQQIDHLRTEMRRAKDRRTEMWVTEIGWASSGEPHPLNRGPKGQARRLRQAFELLRRRRDELNLQLITWYSWRDDTTTGAGICGWCPYSGLFAENGADAKPAWHAFTRFTGGS